MISLFKEQRRQQFLDEALYQKSREQQMRLLEGQRNNLSSVIKDEGEGSDSAEVYSAFVYHEKFWLWMLDYTAGVNLDELAIRFSEVVDEFIEWHRINLLYRATLKEEFKDRQVEIDVSPVDFTNQLHYQDVLQLLGVAILIRDSQSVRRIIKAMDSNRYRDALYEYLVVDFVEDPRDNFNEIIHNKPPYQLLVNIFFEEDDESALRLLNQYLKNWYKHQKGFRWFDAHLSVIDDASTYYGYWAFEAGAVAYILDLDDSNVEHMIYPKDLVAYARILRDKDRTTSSKP